MRRTTLLGRRTTALLGALATTLVFSAAPAWAEGTTPGHADCQRVREMAWDDVLAEAKGQTVHWWMWAGDAGVNQYVDEWVAVQAKEQFDITVVRVPIKDTVEGVQQVVQENQAGKHDGGSVDLNWISSENLRTMIQGETLCTGYQDLMPNAQYIDYDAEAIAYQGTLEVGDTATPWGMYQYVYVYNTEFVPEMPTSFAALAELIKANPGRFTYPAPPDFTGRGMLTNIFYEVTGGADQWIKDRGFNKELWDKKQCALWDYLNDIKPYLWRSGETYPENAAAQNRLFADGELWFTIAAYHATPGRDVEKGVYPQTTRTAVVDVGTIAGSHSISIPYNSSSKAAALVMSNFLISPEAQYQKALPSVWGIGTVLDMDRLSEEWREKFRSMPTNPTTVDSVTLASHQVPTPADYHVPIEEGWTRYVLKGESYSCPQ